MKKMRRGISLLLSVVLVLGMVPVRGYATQCQHTLTYSAEGDCITAVCTNEGCAYRETARLVLDSEASLAYTGKEIKPLKVEYSALWQGEKQDAINYVNNIEVTKLQEAAAEPVNEALPETGTESQNSQEEPKPEDEKEQKTPEGPGKDTEEPKIPAGTLTIGGVSVTKEFAIQKAKLTVTATATAAYGDEAPEYTLVCKDAEGNEKTGIITATDDMMTSDYTQDAEAGREFVIVVNLGDVTSEQYELEAENGSFTVAPRKLTLVPSALEFFYNGQPQAPTLSVKNLVDGDLVEPDYEPVAGTNVASYKIEIKGWLGDEEVLKNYELPADTEVSFVVLPLDAELKLDKAEYVYNGQPHTPVVTIGNLQGEDKLELDYVPVTETEPNTYTITIIGFKTVEGYEAAIDNYNLMDNQIDFTIRNGVQEAPTGVAAVAESIKGKADGRITGVTDEMEYGIKPENTEEEVQYTGITGAEVTSLAAGTYLVRYKAKDKHDASAPAEVTVAPGDALTITLPTTQTGYTLTASKTELAWGESVKIDFELLPGYMTTEDFAFKADGEVATLKDGSYSYTFDQVREDMTLDVTVEGVVPVLTMELLGKKYSAVEDTITFEQYSRTKPTLTITSALGAEGIYYAEKAEKTDPAAIEADDWTAYTAPVTISNTDRNAVFYAKVVVGSDVYYASTNGVVFDTIPPAVTINGTAIQFPASKEVIVDRYTTQIVTVTDENPDIIKLNSVDTTSPITLVRNNAATNVVKRHILRMEDKAGNAVRLTVRMHTIESLKESKKDLNRLDEILEKECANATEEEKAELEQIKQNKDAYLTILMIEALANVQPYDEEDKKAYADAKEAYDDLTDTQKRDIVGTEYKTLLDKAKAALTDYKITTDKDDLEWEKKSKKDLVIKVNGSKDRFEELQIGGKKVDAKKYTCKADSAGMTITIDDTYLETLTVAKHTIKVVFDDGATSGNDKINVLKAGSSIPKTGDDGILFWMTTSVLSLACLALAVLFSGRKRRYQA